MEVSSGKFSQYVRTRPGALSLAAVCVCAVILGYFFVRTFVFPLQKSYPLEFSTAEWISSPGTPHGYFRKTLFLPADVIHAWIQVAAPDTYELFVNNTHVREATFNATCITGIHDLKPYLREGRNTIAIHVSRSTYPGAAQVLARGGYLSATSPPQEFRTDTTWKVGTFEAQVPGGPSWASPDLDDSGWANAAPGRSDGRPETIIPLRFPPELVRDPVPAGWIGPPEVRASQASFRSQIEVPAGRVETWLQVAATGSYDVLINGKLVVSRPIAAPTGTGFRVSERVLSPYNVSSNLRPGPNTILIHVRSESGTPAMLASAIMAHERGRDTFGTDEAWLSSLHTEESRDDWTTHAVVLGRYGDEAWPLTREALPFSQLRVTSDFRSISIWSAVMLGSLCLVFVAWITVSRIWAMLLGRPASDLWTADAMGHWCVAVMLLAILLLTYDIRLAPDWCFTPTIVLGACLALLGSKLLLGFRRSSSPSSETNEPDITEIPRTPAWVIVILVALMGIGCALRVAHLSDISLDVDEVSVVLSSKGILVNGYPHVHMGSFTKRITTYELLNYPLAAAGWLFGYSDAALRLPSLICGTLTIGLIGWMGCRLLDWRAGILSALIYTFHPTCLYWSRNAFWPSQGQFFTLLTFWCFYEALRTEPFRRGWVSAATAGVVCSYLSWEGSGFILPALFVAMLAMRWGSFAWLRNWHLWRCFFIITVVVLLQLFHRKISSIPTYLQTGSSLAEVSTPQVVYLDSTKFDPTYYLTNFVTLESNYLLSLIFVCGLPFCWRDRRLRYLVVLILTLFLSYSFLLPAYSVRYSYHYQTLYILAAAGIVLKCVDGISKVARSSQAGWARSAAWIGSALTVVTFTLATNPFVLKGYRLSSNPQKASFITRTDSYRADYSGPAAFVKERYRPGDAVIAPTSHAFEHYAGLPVNYSLNTLLNKRMSYDGGRDIPRFVDRFRGLPSLQSVEDLQYVHSHHPRVWIVFVPYSSDNSQSPEIEAYLATHQKVMYESYRSRVVLLESAQASTSSARP